MPHHDFLTPNETAEHMRLTVRKLQQLEADGTGPRRIKIGTRKVLYARADVDAWLLAKREPEGAAA